ncbi:MAG: hypothetical protein JWR16_692 [Nevskia sp.]|nr:hypothetical protein [Nevskia sp.]
MACGVSDVGAGASNARSVGGSEFDAHASHRRTTTVHGLYPVHLSVGLVGYRFAGDEQEAEAHHNLDFIEAYAEFRLGPASLKSVFVAALRECWRSRCSFSWHRRWPLLERPKLRLGGGVNLGPGQKNYTARLTKNGRGRSGEQSRLLLEISRRFDF